jgi:hypothetical protein
MQDKIKTVKEQYRKRYRIQENKNPSTRLQEQNQYNVQNVQNHNSE